MVKPAPKSTSKTRRRQRSHAIKAVNLLLVFPCRGEIIGRTILPSIQNDGILAGGATWRGERFNSVFAEPPKLLPAASGRVSLNLSLPRQGVSLLKLTW